MQGAEDPLRGTRDGVNPRIGPDPDDRFARLDQRHLQAGLTECAGQGRADYTAADNDYVMLVHGCQGNTCLQNHLNTVGGAHRVREKISRCGAATGIHALRATRTSMYGV